MGSVVLPIDITEVVEQAAVSPELEDMYLYKA